MQTIKNFKLYLDDTVEVFPVIVPSFTRKGAIDYVKGNGEVVSVKEIDKPFIDHNKIQSALLNGGFSVDEMNYIYRVLDIVQAI